MKNEYLEIAYAAALGQLCFFTGTGFSKAVTEDRAPSWQGLLESVCAAAQDPSALQASLFPGGKVGVLSLEETAQIISIELAKTGKSIHQEISTIIGSLHPSGDNSHVNDFISKRSFTVVTTNYDKLLEEMAGASECQSMTPGMPIPRAESRIKVYHVHGSIDCAKEMVVTSDDYFRFINIDSYFSRKLSVSLHENTVVILGYSLGDTNLKAIFSDYKVFSRTNVIGSNIFLVSRTATNQYVKDYYAHCYGIRVIDRTEISSFFKSLNEALPDAESKAGESIENIRKVIFDKHEFTEGYLRSETSFFEIIASLAATGLNINNKRVVKSIGQIIKTKIELTGENNAWAQYAQLARWLAYLATILDLNGTPIEQTFLDATLRSMNSMSNRYKLGYSWEAYLSWSSHWPGILATNRALIRRHIEASSTWADALAVVKSA